MSTTMRFVPTIGRLNFFFGEKVKNLDKKIFLKKTKIEMKNEICLPMLIVKIKKINTIPKQ